MATGGWHGEDQEVEAFVVTCSVRTETASSSRSPEVERRQGGHDGGGEEVHEATAFVWGATNLELGHGATGWTVAGDRSSWKWERGKEEDGGRRMACMEVVQRRRGGRTRRCHVSESRVVLS